MLEPNSRQPLSALLRPPSEHTLAYALGTTFTLDLPTLLSVPLAMLHFDWQSSEGPVVTDPISLLEGLRQAADRVVLFCQQDRIRVPGTQSRLFAFLESTVIPVSVQNGVFHPKMWVLRFRGPEKSIRYRLLCLTRNLTPDRSWDTVLSLEGQLKARSNAFSANHPLGNFIQSLVDLSAHQLHSAVRDQIASIQEEIRRVDFELPEGFDKYEFWFSGNGSPSFPFAHDYQRMLIISPFLEPALLERLAGVGRGHTLVSRLESLQAIEPRILRAFKRVYYLNPLVEHEDSEGANHTPPADTELNGLHAKLYVAENSWNARLYTGSPNATNAAFSTNVEFLVELTGKKSRVGIDAVMTDSLMALLLEYRPGRDTQWHKPEEKVIEDALNQARGAIAAGAWEANIKGSESNGTCQIELHSTKPWSLAGKIEASCYPITASAKRVTVPPHPLPMSFSLSFEALTSFFAFALVLVQDGKTFEIEFALNVPLGNAPPDRMRQLLYKILESREQVLRLLMLMLADEEDAQEFSSPSHADVNGPNSDTWRAGHDGLFEALVRALDLHPEKLDRVRQLINDLSETEQGRQLLPKGLDQIWRPIELVASRSE